jgi:hypothetical protein
MWVIENSQVKPSPRRTARISLIPNLFRQPELCREFPSNALSWKWIGSGPEADAAHEIQAEPGGRGQFAGAGFQKGTTLAVP